MTAIPNTPPYRARRLPSRRAYRGAIGVTATVFVAWVVTINVTSTIIVSTINPLFVVAVVTLGGMVGLRIGVTIGAVEAAIGRHKIKTRPCTTRMIYGAFGFFCGAIVGNTVAYLLLDTVLFWRSREPVVAVAFPVRSVGLAKGSPLLGIGSEGQYDQIWISTRDYDVLTAAGRLRRPWPYCVSLKRQASYEAVRVWIPARARRSGPQTVFACPAYARWW